MNPTRLIVLGMGLSGLFMAGIAAFIVAATVINEVNETRK